MKKTLNARGITVEPSSRGGFEINESKTKKYPDGRSSSITFPTFQQALDSANKDLFYF